MLGILRHRQAISIGRLLKLSESIDVKIERILWFICGKYMKKITFALVMLLCLLKGDRELPKTWNRKYWAFERRPFSCMTFFRLKILLRFYITLRSTPTNGFRLKCQYSRFSAVPYVTFWTQQNLYKVQPSLRWLYVLVAWIPNNQVHLARMNACWASCCCYIHLVVFLSSVKRLPVCPWLAIDMVKLDNILAASWHRSESCDH